MNVGFIGAGNMGGALARGVSKVLGTNIYIYDINEQKSEMLANEIGAKATTLEEVVSLSDMLFLGVKPNGIFATAKRIAELGFKKTVVSMAAGVSIEKIKKALPESVGIIRIMPNTPVAVGEGVVAYTASENVDKDKKIAFESIMQYTGYVFEIEEDRIDAFSAVAGCGPAYAYMFIDALSEGGVKCGLSKADAMLFAAKMLRGAALMAIETGTDPKILCENVCSPGGSTIEGVKVLRSADFENNVTSAIEAAYKRTLELGKD